METCRLYSTRPIACGAARSKYDLSLASRTCTTAVIRAPTDHEGPPRDMYSRLLSLEGGASCCGVETHASSSRKSQAFSTARPGGMRLPVPARILSCAKSRVSGDVPGWKSRQRYVSSRSAVPPTTISFGAITISGGTWTIGAEGFRPHPVTNRVRKTDASDAFAFVPTFFKAKHVDVKANRAVQFRNEEYWPRIPPSPHVGYHAAAWMKSAAVETLIG